MRLQQPRPVRLHPVLFRRHDGERADVQLRRRTALGKSTAADLCQVWKFDSKNRVLNKSDDELILRFRRERGQCRICWTATTITDFAVSGKTNVASGKVGVRTTSLFYVSIRNIYKEDAEKGMFHAGCVNVAPRWRDSRNLGTAF